MDLDVTGLFYKQENCELEYKQGYNVEDIAQSMAAFATSGGGYILLGVKPDGSPAGFATPSEDEMRNNLYSIAKASNRWKNLHRRRISPLRSRQKNSYNQNR